MKLGESRFNDRRVSRRSVVSDKQVNIGFAAFLAI